MADTTQNPSYTEMYLGRIQFTGFEIPAKLPLGHKQKVVVNDFAGRNKRAIHVMGAQPRELCWDGRFLYQTAVPRARYLDTLCQAGESLIFVYGDFVYRTVIEEFNFEINHAFDVEYTIRLQVIADLTDSFKTLVESQDTIEKGILGIIEAIGEILSIFRKAVSVIKAVQSGDISRIIGSVSTITSGLGNVTNLFSLDTTVITGYAKDFNILASSTQNLVNQFAPYASGSGIPSLKDLTFGPGTDLDGPSAVVLEGKRIVNLATMGEALLRRLLLPPFSSEITVFGTNLFDVAIRYYGDINAWETIADFNNLDSAQLSKPTKLRLPPRNGVLPNLTNEGNQEPYDVNLFNIPASERTGSVTSGLPPRN